MSALWDADRAAPGAPRRLVPMTTADVDAVMAIENGVYPFPWSRGNFIDSLAAGYVALLLQDGDDATLIGYCVALSGAGEMHLLNITVATPHRHRGHARFLIAELVDRCRRGGEHQLWLEVRESNDGARTAYRRLGFVERGVRPGYYPAAHARRESAVVMSLAVPSPDGAGDALD